MSFGAIILADGLPFRTGALNPLLEIGGRSLIDRCGALFSQAGIQEILVVSGSKARDVEAEALQLGLTTIHNPDFSAGLLWSVRLGLGRLSNHKGIFILPADIPLVRPATLSSLVSVFDGISVIYPCFDGRRGHPLLIPAALIPVILNYAGQDSLKELLERHKCRDVAVWDQGILPDTSTEEGFTVLQQRFSRVEIGEPAETLALARQTMSAKGLEHGLAVARVADALGLQLVEHGCALDLVLLHNAALLHDIAKGLPQHEKMGADMLRDLGLGRLSPLVAAHRNMLPPRPGQITETEVVFLADKLIRGSRRIRLQERFNEKLELYKNNRKAYLSNKIRLKNALAVKAEIEKIIGGGVEELLQEKGVP
ncbi:MAG: NTP transferase domain-containing protein [Desulfocapsaceae bacterium]|nr:NTP transferase domain-containing protein [Desulfocapsaceae bacterium]